MRVRAATSLDAQIAVGWRVAHGEAAIPESALPTTGAVCEHGEPDEPIASMWLYLTNSTMAYLAWPTTRPGLRPRVASEALTLLATELIALARSLGVQFIISTSSSRGLTKLLRRCGLEQRSPHDFMILPLEVSHVGLG